MRKLKVMYPTIDGLFTHKYEADNFVINDDGYLHIIRHEETNHTGVRKTIASYAPGQWASVMEYEQEAENVQ